MNTRNPHGMGDLDAAAYRLAGSISARIGAYKRSPNRVLAGPRLRLLDGYEGAAQ